MPRRLITEEHIKKENMPTESEAEERLKHLVSDYIANNEMANDYKKAASAQNTEIKALMSEFNLKEVVSDAGAVTLSDKTSETFIEDKLIEFLKTRNIAYDIVKTKEYVDFDALESAIYHEKITGDNLKDMSSCKEIKVTQVLRVKKK